MFYEKVFGVAATSLLYLLPMSQTPEFEEVYQEQADFVYSLSRRLSREATEADDLFQEVFLKVYRFLPKYQGGSLRGWLRRIAVTTYTSMKRGQKNQPMIALEDKPGWKENVPDPSAGPLELTERNQDKEVLEAALGCLTEDFRTIIILRELEDLDYSEISEVLDIPVGTVRSRLARARMALRKELEKSDG